MPIVLIARLPSCQSRVCLFETNISYSSFSCSSSGHHAGLPWGQRHWQPCLRHLRSSCSRSVFAPRGPGVRRLPVPMPRSPRVGAAVRQGLHRLAEARAGVLLPTAGLWRQHGCLRVRLLQSWREWVHQCCHMLANMTGVSSQLICWKHFHVVLAL